VPLCGYCGALNRSRTALLCFSISNIVLALVFIASVVVAITLMGGDLPSCACDAQCRVAYGIPDADAIEMCNNADYFRTLWWLGVAFGCLMVILQFMGCFYGLKLVASPHFKIEMQYPVAFEVVEQPVQPTMVYVPGEGYYPVHPGGAPVYYARSPPPVRAVRVGHRSMSEGAYYVSPHAAPVYPPQANTYAYPPQPAPAYPPQQPQPQPQNVLRSPGYASAAPASAPPSVSVNSPNAGRQPPKVI
jgi:hypothetical protein